MGTLSSGRMNAIKLLLYDFIEVDELKKKIARYFSTDEIPNYKMNKSSNVLSSTPWMIKSYLNLNRFFYLFSLVEERSNMRFFFKHWNHLILCNLTFVKPELRISLWVWFHHMRRNPFAIISLVCDKRKVNIS